MGLRQEVETSFGNQPDRPLPHPARAGLSRFNFQISRRRFLKRTVKAAAGGAALALGLSTVSGEIRADSPTEVTTDISLMMSDRAVALNQAAVKLFGADFDLTGNPISRGWNEAGRNTEVFDNMQLEINQAKETVAVPILDQAHESGLDNQLADPYSSLNPIPARADITFTSKDITGKIQESIDYWQLDQAAADFISKLNQLLKVGPVVGYTNLGTEESPIEVFRTPSVAFLRGAEGPNANQFVMINAGVQTQGLVWPAVYALSPADTATGGGTTPTPEETSQLPSSELFETTPQGRLATEKFKEGEVGWKPRKESADKTDEFFNQLNVKVIFISNPSLRGGVGTWTLQPCETCTKTPERYGILRGSVDPSDPKTLIMEYNIFRPEYKLDPAWREQLADLTAGAVVGDLSKIIFGKSKDDLPQEQRNYIGQLSYRLQYETRPLELIAPTTG